MFSARNTALSYLTDENYLVSCEIASFVLFGSEEIPARHPSKLSLKIVQQASAISLYHYE